MNRALAMAKKNPLIILGGAGIVVMLFIATKAGKNKAPAIDNTPITYNMYPGGSYSGTQQSPAPIPAPVPGVPLDKCSGPFAFLDPSCPNTQFAPCNGDNCNPPIPHPNPNPNPNPDPGPHIGCQAGYHWNGSTCVPDIVPGPQGAFGGVGDYQFTVYDDFTSIWDSMKVAA